MLIVDTTQLDENASNYSPTEIYHIYNALDCCVTMEVFEKIEPQLDAVSRPIYERGMALVAPVMEMMLEGLETDQHRMNQLRYEFIEKLSELEHNWQRLLVEGLGLQADRTKRKGRKPVAVSPSSPKDVQYLFHTVLGIPEKTKRKKGQSGSSVTTDRAALESFRSHFFAEPFVNYILAMRDQQKSISFLNTKSSDGKFHCSFNVAGTNTGRLSSSFADDGEGTNLQNITGKLKDVFAAPEGWMYVDVDLEQGDSRGVGAIAWNFFVESHGEEFAGAYLDACESGDLHTTVCRMAWTNLNWGDDPGGWKSVATTPAYRDKSYRDLAKGLGHGCLTSDHEVLTPDGWVPISSLPSVIMQWKEGESCFAETSHWEAKPYTGTLHNFEGNSLSAVMTHDHRVPYKSDPRARVVKERPAEAGPQAFMPLGNGWTGGKEEVPARLIAAFMADGSRGSGKQSTFHFTKGRKVSRLKKLCEQYGYTYSESVTRDHTFKIRINDGNDWPKHPGPFMLNWTKECLEDFVDELKYWDGHIGKTSVTISSTRKDDLEWFQTFGRICGIGGSVSKPKLSGFGSTVYGLQQNKRQWATGKSVKHTKKAVVNVMVYCPTVPSGWFYVRRNGKIFVTGNTNYMGKPPTMAATAKLPIDLIVDFQKAYYGAFPCIPAWQNETIRQLQTTRQLISPWGRRRFFWGDPRESSVINAAIAYAPQNTTGEFTNLGMLQLWHYRNQKNLPIRFLLQVHDSLVFLVRQDAINEMIPLILEKLRVYLTLKKGRQFTIPHGCKVGWNYGAASDKNPYGLSGWKGEEKRKPPKRRDNLLSLLATPANMIR